MGYYRYCAKYVYHENSNDMYSFRSLVPFSLEKEKKRYFVHNCYTSEPAADPTLRVFSLGYERDWPQKVEGPCSNDRLIVYYVMSGRGFFNGMEVTQGHYFYSCPNETFEILNDPNNPMELCYIGVDGIRVKEVMKNIGFQMSPSVVAFSFGENALALIQNALYHVPEGMDYEVYFQSVFVRLMAYHKNENRKFETIEMPNRYAYYERAMMFIQRHLTDGVSVSDVARYLHISQSYLKLIFSEFSKYSAREIILRKKMNCAIDYLLTSNHSTFQIASKLGYEDRSQFVRVFKKYVGMSPSECRKRYGDKGDSSVAFPYVDTE